MACNIEDSGSDDFEETQKEVCRTYLLTYSKANLRTVPDQKRFRDIVLEGFEIGDSLSDIKQYAVCTEEHADKEHIHYHMAMLLSSPRRWRPIHRYIYELHNVSVHFSCKALGYLGAYRYVCKDKPHESILHSPGHPILKNAKSPKSKRGFRKSSQNSRKRRSDGANAESSEAGPSKTKPAAPRKRLTNAEVAKFLVENDIRTETQLMSIAKQRQSAEEPDLYNFILNKTSKSLSELIATTWKMHHAPSVVEREQKCRLDVVLETSQKSCVAGCNGRWLEAAREVLRNNNINIYVFADALRQCIKVGRKKNNNIILTGPTNCGKTFLISPLELMFDCFVNPASGKYAWVGLDECQLLFLNDFRWSPELIAWNEFLLLLEGQTVHLPRPKNQFSSDMVIKRENSMPILATSKEAIELVGKYNVKDQRETDMMSSRWREFNFGHQIPKEDIKDLEPCPRCFCTLVVQGMDA